MICERRTISRSIERHGSGVVSLSRNSSNPVRGAGRKSDRPERSGRIQMVAIGSRCVAYAAEEMARPGSRVLVRGGCGIRRGGCPWSGRGRHSLGPRVNDHRKLTCVTSREKPYSVALLTRTTSVSGCVCALLASLSLSLFSLSCRLSSFSWSITLRSTREATLPISNHHRWKHWPLLSRLTSVMKRFLPSSFILSIYRFNYPTFLLARCDSPDLVRKNSKRHLIYGDTLRAI